MYLLPHTITFGKEIRGFNDYKLFVIDIKIYFIGDQSIINFRSAGQGHEIPVSLIKILYINHWECLQSS